MDRVSDSRQENPFPLRVRVVQMIFLALAVVATLLLAWWQWTRFRSGSGSFQNLGYALQWPVFGVFFIIAYRKYIEYERDRMLGDETPAAPSTDDEMRALPEDLLPTRVPEPTVEVDDRRRSSRRGDLTAALDRDRRPGGLGGDTPAGTRTDRPRTPHTTRGSGTADPAPHGGSSAR